MSSSRPPPKPTPVYHHSLPPPSGADTAAWDTLAEKYSDELGGLSLPEFRALEKDELDEFVRQSVSSVGDKARFRRLYKGSQDAGGGTPSASSSSSSIASSASSASGAARRKPRPAAGAAAAGAGAAGAAAGAAASRRKKAGGSGGKDVVSRLTDSSSYTGTHKHRFDNEGKGRGLDGRDVGAKGKPSSKPLFRLDKGDKPVRDLSEITRPGVNSYRPPEKRKKRPKQKLSGDVLAGKPVVVARGEKGDGTPDVMRETVVLSKKRRCRACRKPIESTGYEYEGGHYHPACLCCVMCERPFPQGQGMYPRDGELHCKLCYAKRYADRCGRCLRLMTEGAIVTLDHPDDPVRNVRFHESCFACQACSRDLLDGYYTLLSPGDAESNEKASLSCRDCAADDA